MERLFLFLPVISHPKGRLDESELSIAFACQGIGWVAFAVENYNARIFGNGGRCPVIGRPCWDAVVLETGTPLSGPVGQLALFVQKVRQVGLLISELLANAVKVVAEVLKHIRMGAQLISVNRRVAGNAPGPLVVVNDHEVARHFKETIHAAHNDHVDI